MNFKKTKFKRADYREFDALPEKPINFELMKNLAKILSKGKKFLRVDLYEINKKVYFGELTFTPCGGYLPFEPGEYDKILGDMFDVGNIKKGKIDLYNYEK